MSQKDFTKGGIVNGNYGANDNPESVFDPEVKMDKSRFSEYLKRSLDPANGMKSETREYCDFKNGLTGWQPIETAPKDGSPVIILVPESDTETAIQANFLNGRWIPDALDFHGCGCCGGGNVSPTHWTPLPKSPIKE